MLSAIKFTWVAMAIAAMVLMVRGFYGMTYIEFTVRAQRAAESGQREAYVAAVLLLGCAVLALRLHSMPALVISLIVSVATFVLAWTRQNGTGLLALIVLVPMVLAAMAAVQLARSTD